MLSIRTPFETTFFIFVAVDSLLVMYGSFDDLKAKFARAKQPQLRFYAARAAAERTLPHPLYRTSSDTCPLYTKDVLLVGRAPRKTSTLGLFPSRAFRNSLSPHISYFSRPKDQDSGWSKTLNYKNLTDLREFVL